MTDVSTREGVRFLIESSKGEHPFFLPMAYNAPHISRRRRRKIGRRNRTWKLFDLANDIRDEHDLGEQHPERLKQMIAEVGKLSRSHTQLLRFDNA